MKCTRVSLVWFLRFILIFFFFGCLVKSINLSCLFCPSPTLPVQALLRSWTSSGPWMAHCYACSSVAVWADAMSSRISGPCTKLVAHIQHEAVNYIPLTHKHSALNWVSAVLSTIETSIAFPDFVWMKTAFRQWGKWPHSSWPWPRRGDHTRTAGLWTSYPCVPGVNSLVAAWGQPAVRSHFLVKCRTCFDWVPVARWPHGD